MNRRFLMRAGAAGGLFFLRSVPGMMKELK